MPRLVHQVVGPHVSTWIGIPSRATREKTVVDVTYTEQGSSFVSASLQLHHIVLLRHQEVVGQAFAISVRVHVGGVDVIGLSVCVEEESLVARVAPIGTEHIHQCVGTFHLVGSTHSHFCLTIVVSVLPVNPHHPFLRLFVINHLGTFQCATTGYVAVLVGFGACWTYGSRQFRPRIKVFRPIAANAIALVRIALFTKPIIVAINIDHASAMSIDSRSIGIVPSVPRLNALANHRCDSQPEY